MSFFVVTTPWQNAHLKVNKIFKHSVKITEDQNVHTIPNPVIAWIFELKGNWSYLSHVVERKLVLDVL